MFVRRTTLSALAAALLGATAPTLGQPGPVHPALTYQGRLIDESGNADGTYEMYFEVYNQQTGGSFVSAAGSAGSPLTVPVTNGLFTVDLDLHPGQTYNGTERWLQIRLRRAGTTQYTLLTPRQRLAPAPFANLALNAQTAATATTAETANSAATADFASDIPGQWKAFQFVPGVGPIYNGTGRVGIGTDAPMHPLHVQSSSNVVANLLSSATNGTALQIDNSSAPNISWRLLAAGSSWNGEQGHFMLAPAFSPPVVKISPTGLVGIAASPSSQHRVIVAGSVCVNTFGSTGLTIGSPNRTSGGGSSLVLSVTNTSEGRSQLQAISRAGIDYGVLALNPAGGRVTVGDLSSSQSFMVVHDPAQFYENVLEVFAGGSAFRVRSNGNLAGCGITCVSDERQKERVEPIANALRDVLALRGVTFHWKPDLKRDPRRQYGFIAQEVEKVLPNLVETDSEGMKSVNYVALTAVLAEAIEEQQTQIERMRADMAALTERLARLEGATNQNHANARSEP